MRNEIVRSNVPKVTVYLRRNELIPAGMQVGLHYHDELELIAVTAGEFHVTVGESDYAAGAGDVIFINTRVPHSTYAATDSGYILLQFRETDFIDGEIFKIIKYSARFREIGDEPVRIIRSDSLTREIDGILLESEGREVGYDFLIRGGIFRLLGSLYRMGVLSNAEEMYLSKEVQKILSALSYINSHYGEDISLDEVAALERLDPSYFCRVFKAATGATFTEYLNFVRVCKAETQLARTNDSILEISERVGFSSVSYFGRMFKRYRGCSPRTYRNARYIAISKGEKEEI